MHNKLTAFEDVEKVMTKILNTDQESVVSDPSENDEIQDHTSEYSDHYTESTCHSTEGDDDFVLASGAVGIYISKNKKIKWDKKPLNRSQIRLSEETYPSRDNTIRGPTHIANKSIDSISSCFKLFFNENIVSLIIKNSNLNGKEMYGVDWINIDTTEIYTFFALLLISGVYRSRDESINELWDKAESLTIFTKAMTRKRFYQIKKALVFTPPVAIESKIEFMDDSTLQPIKSIFDEWNKALASAYKPYDSVTINEQYVNFKGPCPFKKRIRLNKDKYGIKFWVLCDSVTSYVHRMHVCSDHRYEEDDEDTANIAIAKADEENEKIFVSFIKNLETSVTNITCPKQFTSLELIDIAREFKMTLLGPIMKTREEVPLEFKLIKKRSVCSSIFGFRENATLMSYYNNQKNRIVLLLSSRHFTSDISDTDNVKKQPRMLIDYYRTKDAVDKMNNVIKMYTVMRKTRRWHLAVLFNMIDISVFNAFIIWLHFNPTWQENNTHKRRQFIIELSRQLIGYLNIFMGGLSASFEVISNVEIKEYCKYCKKDKKAFYSCDQCKEPVCQAHAIVLCHKCSYKLE